MTAVFREVQSLRTQMEELENYYMLVGKWTFLHRWTFKVGYWVCDRLETW